MTNIICFMFLLLSLFSAMKSLALPVIIGDNDVESKFLVANFTARGDNALLSELKGGSKKTNELAKNAKGKEIVNVEKKPSAERMSRKDVLHERATKTIILNGYASWYGYPFHGQLTASGAVYDMYMYTAAHRTMPLGTIVEISETNNENKVVVCVNDRGPYIIGRAIDVSYKVAEQLNILDKGITPVTLRVVGTREGKIIPKGKAFYVDLRNSKSEQKIVGPFTYFADASTMCESLNEFYPQAAIVMRSVEAK